MLKVAYSCHMKCCESPVYKVRGVTDEEFFKIIGKRSCLFLLFLCCFYFPSHSSIPFPPSLFPFSDFPFILTPYLHFCFIFFLFLPSLPFLPLLPSIPFHPFPSFLAPTFSSISSVPSIFCFPFCLPLPLSVPLFPLFDPLYPTLFLNKVTKSIQLIFNLWDIFLLPSPCASTKTLFQQFNLFRRSIPL